MEKEIKKPTPFIFDALTERCWFCKEQLEERGNYFLYKMSLGIVGVHNRCIETIEDNVLQKLETDADTKIKNFFTNMTQKDPEFEQFYNTEFGEIFDRGVLNKLEDPDCEINYDQRISSYAEVINCSISANARDIAIHKNDGTLLWIDRDGGASQYDSYVQHQCNVDRDLTIGILLNAVENINLDGKLRSKRHICMVTSMDTFINIYHAFPKILQNRGMRYYELLRLLNIKSFYITEKVPKDTTGRIFFIDTSDPYINEPRLHAKVRDLQ